MATAYQSPAVVPVILRVQSVETLVPVGNDDGGHTSPHSLLPLANRHRTLSLSSSIVGIDIVCGIPAGI